MFQNTPCCEFIIDNDVCTKFEVLCKDLRLLPYDCNVNEFPNYKKNLVIFFYDRTTPPTRQFLKEALEAIGMKYYDMSRLIMFQHGLAQDPYWIRTVDSPQTWEAAKQDMIQGYFSTLNSWRP